MDVVSIKGVPAKGGLPRGCHLRVESLPKRTVVYDDTVSSGVQPLVLGPGKYAAKVVHFPRGRPDLNVVYGFEFLHGMTEEQYKRLRFVAPTTMKGRMTTEGFVYSCGFPGCGEKLNSNIAAVIHENEHRGIDVLTNADEAMRVARDQSDPALVASEAMRLKREAELQHRVEELTDMVKMLVSAVKVENADVAAKIAALGVKPEEKPVVETAASADPNKPLIEEGQEGGADPIITDVGPKNKSNIPGQRPPALPPPAGQPSGPAAVQPPPRPRMAGAGTLPPAPPGSGKASIAKPKE